jgi:hypothetical protein
MPSENSGLDSGDLTVAALEALTPRVEAFHSAVATAVEEIRTFVTSRRGASEYRAEQAIMELGPFAVGRLNAEKFAFLMGNGERLSTEAESVLERAEEILDGFSVGEELHRVVVGPGEDLRDAVKDALDHVGQVFGASRAVELARDGRFDPAQHNVFLSSLPFRKWNRSERQLAPPLVVEVGNEDLLPAGLGEFLDGLVKIVLVVKGPTTPAPLARLITPGTYVVQTADVAELSGLASSPHPGVALLFDEERDEQARFVHDPDAGPTPSQRITVTHMPEKPSVGHGRRTPVWLEELEHLEALASKPAGVALDVEGAVSAAPREEEVPADRLAALLLSQVDPGTPGA